MSFAQANPLLPPFSTPLANPEGGLTPFWLGWFNQLYQIYYTNLQIALNTPQHSTTAIGEIQTSSQPFIVFDSTLGKFKGWDGTQYVVFTTVP